MTPDDAGADTPHVPLPPEQPKVADELSENVDDPPLDLTKGADTGEDTDFVAAGSTAEPTDAPSVPVDASGETPGGADKSPPAADWWRGTDVRDELRETWHTDGGEVAAAAQEVGHQMQQAAGAISDAVAGVAYPAAARQKLDIRWMRLSINIPAIVLALLATWGGQTATDRMIATIVEDGPFAPLGGLLFAVLLLGVLALTPIGSPLAQALAGLVQGLGHGLVTALRRGWRAPGVGYVLRLAVAWLVWAFIFGIVRVAGRGLIHWLTGA